MDYTERRDLIQRLADTRPDDDIDKKAAEGYEDQILELFADCYDGDDLLKWLVDHDFDPFYGFRFAETETKEDWIEYSYNPEEDGDDPEEAWENYLNEGDFLFVRDDREEVVKSW